ncbi:unnamed protein product, partial [Allacma fusca]
MKSSKTSENVRNTGIILISNIVECLGKTLSKGRIPGAHPFNWNPDLQRLEMVSGLQESVWRFNMVIAFAHALFVYIRCIQIEIDDIPVSSYQRIFMRFMVAWYTLGPVLHFGIISKRNDIVLFVNQYMETMKNFESKFVKDDATTPKLVTSVGIVMQIINYSFRGIWLVMTAGSAARPTSHEQISSLFVNNSSSSLFVPVIILNAIFMAHNIYIFYSSASVIVQTPLAAFPLFTILDELNPEKTSITRGELRRGPNFIIFYKCILLIVNFGNQIWTETFLPAAKFLMIISCVLCTCGAFRMKGLFAVGLGILAVFTFGFLVMLFTLLAEIHSRSLKLKGWCKSSGIRDPVFKRALNALP